MSSLQLGSVKKIILSRPAVEAGEKLGFLPGDLKEKVDPFLRPIYDALYEMMPYDQVEKKIANIRDKDFNLTGVTSTGFSYGISGLGEIEMYYGDKDPADLQITSAITHNNTSTNDEVQFIMAFDTGSGYVEDPITTISVTNPRATPRSNTSTITTLKRFKKGDLFKFLYRYVDITTSVIDNITITVH